jgi:dTDP-glucose 4,6-dehydratase
VLDELTYAGSLDNLAGALDQIEFVNGDITDRPLVDELVERTDIVVHFAAESHNDNSFLDPLRFVETNTLGAAVVLDAVRLHGKRMHHISTDEVYGSLDLDEDRLFAPDSPLQPTSF